MTLKTKMNSVVSYIEEKGKRKRAGGGGGGGRKTYKEFELWFLVRECPPSL